MARPFHRLNSVMAEDLPSLPMSLSLRTPAMPPSAMPTKHTTTPTRTIGPPALVPEWFRSLSANSPFTIGGTSVPNAAQ